MYNWGLHVSTHVNAPCNKVKGGARLHDIPFENFTGPAVVIDIKEQCDKNSKYQLTVKDIKDWEKEHGCIPKGAIVLVR